MNQDETWHPDRPQPRPHCVRWGPHGQGHNSPPVSKFTSAGFACDRIIRGPRLIVWIKILKIPFGTKVGLGPGHTPLDGEQLPQKGGTSPNFPPMCVVAKRLDGSSSHPGLIVLDRDLAPPKGDTPRFSAHICCDQTAV